MRECFTDPHLVYREAKARGMTHVTLTDHDTIAGALQLADFPDFTIGEEISAFFPTEALHVHVLVWGVNEAHHREIGELRFNIFELVDYLRREGLAHALAHPMSVVSELRVEHYEQLLLLFALWETRNGSSTPIENRISAELVAASPTLIPRLAEKYGREPVPRPSARSPAPTTTAASTSAAPTRRSAWEPARPTRSPRSCGARRRCAARRARRPRRPTRPSASSSTAATATRATGCRARWCAAACAPASPGRCSRGSAAGSSPDASSAWRSTRPGGAREAGRCARRPPAAPPRSSAAAPWSAAACTTSASPSIAETTWERTVRDCFEDLRGKGFSRESLETWKTLGQAQTLIAPYLLAATSLARQRIHARDVHRDLSDKGLLEPWPTPAEPHVAMFTDTIEEINGVAAVLQPLVAFADDPGLAVHHDLLRRRAASASRPTRSFGPSTASASTSTRSSRCTCRRCCSSCTGAKTTTST